MFELIRRVWEWVKKIFESLLNFGRNIVSWFQDPSRVRALEEDHDRLAVVVKDRLDNGNYNTIKCLFNCRTNKIEGTHNASNKNAEGIESNDLDSETKKHFGNKEMLVLE